MALSLGLGSLMAWGVAAEPPPGDPGDVETPGSRMAAPGPTALSPSNPDRSLTGLTRASVFAEVESIDPALWLRHFGPVEARPLSPSE
ncbi:MAG: hypothetical protein VCC04_05920 [Myxococcota bacterium]